MGNIKGITVGTYLTKRIKNKKHKNTSKEKICSKYFEKSELRNILEELVNLDANSKVRIN